MVHLMIHAKFWVDKQKATGTGPGPVPVSRVYTTVLDAYTTYAVHNTTVLSGGVG